MLKKVKVIYTNQPVGKREEVLGYLIENKEDMYNAVNLKRLNEVAIGGVSEFLDSGEIVFVNPAGGYCGVKNTIQIISN